MTIPIRATYRLQLHSGFTLESARAIVPYLAKLGISHIYASPVLRSRPGSTHGYDVVDPTRLDPELGSDASWDALISELRAHDMGMVLDIVPNHMGVGARQSVLGRSVRERSRLALRNVVRHRLEHARARSQGSRAHSRFSARSSPRRSRRTRSRSRSRAVAFASATSITASRSIPPRFPRCSITRSLRCQPMSRRRTSRSSRAFGSRSPRFLRGSRSAPALVERRQREAPELLRRLEALREPIAAACVARSRARRATFASGDGGPRATRRAPRLAGVRARLLAPRGARDQLPPLLRHQRARRAAHGGSRRVRRDAPPHHPVGEGRAARWSAHRSRGRAARSARLSRAPPRRRAPGARGLGHPDLRREDPLRRASGCAPSGRWTGTTGYEFLAQLETRSSSIPTVAARSSGRIATSSASAARSSISTRSRCAARRCILRGSLASDVQRLARLLAADRARAIARTQATRRARSSPRASCSPDRARSPCIAPTWKPERVDGPRGRSRGARARVRGGARARRSCARRCSRCFGRASSATSRRSTPSGTSRARRVRAALPADERSRDGEGRRGHRALSVLAARLAQRSRRAIPRASSATPSAASTARTSSAQRAGRARCSPRARTTPSAAPTCARASMCSPRFRASGRARLARWRRAHRASEARVRGRLAPDAHTEYLLYQTLVGMWPAARAADGDEPTLAARADARRTCARRRARRRRARAGRIPTRSTRARSRPSFARSSTRPEFLPTSSAFVASIAPSGALERDRAHACCISRRRASRTSIRATSCGTVSLVDPDNRRPVDYDIARATAGRSATLCHRSVTYRDVLLTN